MNLSTHSEEYVLLCETHSTAKANTSKHVVKSGANNAWIAASHHVPKTTNTQVRVAYVYDALNVFEATTLKSSDRHMVERSHHIARRLASCRAIAWRLIRNNVPRTSTKHLS